MYKLCHFVVRWNVNFTNLLLRSYFSVFAPLLFLTQSPAWNQRFNRFNPFLSSKHTPSEAPNQMADTGTPPALSVLLIFLLVAAPQPSNSVFHIQFQTVFSLTHSLMNRVADMRASRGDLAGSNRAKVIASMLERATGLNLKRSMWSLGWYYLRNYAWEDGQSFELLRAVSDIKQLQRSLNELTRMESDADRSEWVRQNYKNTIEVSKSLFQRFLNMFRQSGPLREMVEMVHIEVVEGDLLRDCFGLGSSDLKDLLEIYKNIASLFSTTDESTEL
ncbi:hypothetical protein NMG60_11015063 [Bertholletia excelsa]